MKKKVLLALGLLIALEGTFAQTKDLPDTIFITPFADAKLVMTGNGMERLANQNNFEILKNKFIADYQESAKDQDFPANAKHIIYLVSADGRRRLKAEEETTLNVEKELNSFRANLPPYHYAIYDLPNNFEYHIYLKHPSHLDSLKDINLVTAISNATKDTDLPLKRYSKLNLVSKDGEWKQIDTRVARTAYLELTPFAAARLINSSWSPGFGFSSDFRFSDKYGQNKFKAGAEFMFNTMGFLDSMKFKNVFLVTTYDLRFMVNISKDRSKSPTWFGISGGLMKSSDGGSLDNKYKVGVVGEKNGFGVNADFFKDDNDKSNMGVTLKYYF